MNFLYSQVPLIDTHLNLTEQQKKFLQVLEKSLAQQRGENQITLLAELECSSMSLKPASSILAY